MSFDRRIGLILAMIVGVVLVTATSANERADAAPALIAFLEASHDNNWLVEYQATRTKHDTDDVLGRATAEARFDGATVLREPTSVTTQRASERVVCNLTSDGPACLTANEPASLPEANVVRELVDSGAYVVTEINGKTYSGVSARCFRVQGILGYVPEYGLQREYCFAEGGAPLRTTIVRVEVVDERIATAVNLDPSLEDVEALVTSLEEEELDLES